MEKSKEMRRAESTGLENLLLKNKQFNTKDHESIISNNFDFDKDI
jgi:hypothetical protein